MDAPAETARQRLMARQGQDGLYFAGAWMGDGFHEDGLRSAVAIGEAMGIAPPWHSTPAGPATARPAAMPEGPKPINGGGATPAAAPAARPEDI